MSYITLSSDPCSRIDLIRCIESKDEHRLDGCSFCGQYSKRTSLLGFKSFLL
jgi:hypothetical protein